MELKQLVKGFLAGLIFLVVSLGVQYVVSLFLYPWYFTAASSGIGVTLVMIILAILFAVTVLGLMVLWVAEYVGKIYR